MNINIKTLLPVSLFFFIASIHEYNVSRESTQLLVNNHTISNKRDSLYMIFSEKNLSFSTYIQPYGKSDTTAACKPIVKMQVPRVSARFYKPLHIKKIKTKIEKINHRYGAYIKQASRLTNVPENLIASFIFIESSGHARSLNKKSGAAGLMQLTEASCSDIIYLKFKQSKLSIQEEAVLRKTIGARLDCILGMKHMGQKRRCNGNIGYNIYTEDLYNPEFNILCGAIFLGILIDKHTERGTVRLDKIVAKYNIGFFSKITGNTPEEVMMHTNSQTRSYIKKLAGTNGILDIMAI